MVKYRLKYGCPLGRYKYGEIGVPLENTYKEKYDFLLDLGSVSYYSEDSDELKIHNRHIYFYKDEVELVKEVVKKPSVSAEEVLKHFGIKI